MGACISAQGGITEEEKAKHREAERQLREAKIKLDNQVKVLLLGAGDSGKSTILKVGHRLPDSSRDGVSSPYYVGDTYYVGDDDQMRLIHDVHFSPQEFEFYRQLVFSNITQGMKQVLEAFEDMELQLPEDMEPYAQMLEEPPDVKDGQPFPSDYYEPLKALWENSVVQKAWGRGNEAALPDNLPYFLGHLERVFKTDYYPSEQDIIRCKARTVGITETMFKLRSHEMLMVDVGGQKSERRKWIHCFQDVTTILFLVSLSGYDQCLVEDKDANQMQDAMTIWDSICHSQWFRQTSIDYEGEPGDAIQGRDYFRSRFTKLSRKSGQAREREIYVHFTNATDTALLRVVMAAVEGTRLLSFYSQSAVSDHDNALVPLRSHVQSEFFLLSPLGSFVFIIAQSLFCLVVSAE
ncbi:guanine nucleotide-binding protein alpha-2 subunit [Sanghuangporus baumii]|uniref:Guanine nucleotide-binding protein alpha-2 subunit n=1 Tax=Sanghuangporus baumii TaxID=108892 RepID=A0A9Q5I1Z1_SANBA|nr:guanine nucleotide-binding protein alpha-2 subunit [Sanghuangporus baumii]